MATFVIADGGMRYNKGQRCIWVKLHDGTTHKLVVDEADAGEPLKLEAPADE